MKMYDIKNFLKLQNLHLYDKRELFDSLHYVEEYLGENLYDSDKKRYTPRGEKVRESFQKILFEIDFTEKKVKNRKTRIGVPVIGTRGILKKYILKVMESELSDSIIFISGDLNELRKRLSENQLDMLFDFRDHENKMGCLFVLEHLKIGLAYEEKIKVEFTLDDVMKNPNKIDKPIIAIKESDIYDRLFEKYKETLLLNDKKIIEVDSKELAELFIEEGLGVGFFIENFFADENIIFKAGNMETIKLVIAVSESHKINDDEIKILNLLKE